MSIGKQTIRDSEQDQYAGYVNYGEVLQRTLTPLASEALVFLLVITRSH